MMGALSVVGSSVVDSHTCPCLILDALTSSSMNMNPKCTGDSAAKRHFKRPATCSLRLSSSFVGFRQSDKALTGNRGSRKQRKKAVRTVMNQLYEMNPTKYRWFYE